MTVEMVPVDSSAVEAVGFELGDLYVKYRDGGLYVYLAVPEWLHRDLVNADSIGGFLNREIKPHYECRES